jgi:hypothetical protein
MEAFASFICARVSAENFLVSFVASWSAALKAAVRATRSTYALATFAETAMGSLRHWN